MPSIKIDDKSYDLDQASSAAQAQLFHVQAIDVEINRMSTLIAIMQTARGNYLRALQEELEKPPSQAASADASGTTATPSNPQ